MDSSLMQKGELVTVLSESAGRGVNCVLVDIDHTNRKIWVRFPTNQVLEMTWNARRRVYEGRMAKMDFRVEA